MSEAAPQPIASTSLRTLSASLATGVGAARAAILVIALHLVDDAFLQPEPGMSAGDHLATLVPLTLLVGVAAAYGRLRPGARASWALVLGVFGIAAGVEAAYYTVNGGPSGDDFTGWLSLAAGLGLVALGAATLWRTRRTDDRLWRRYGRRLLLTVAGLLVASQIMFPVVIAQVVTHTLRAHVPTPDLGAAHEDVSFTTSDGLRLQGWFVPSRNGATVIVVPGRSGPQKQTRLLVRNGYGVLLFDRRGEGASEGDPNMFGWGGERDLHAAAAYLQSRPDVDPARIGAIGLSVGGEMLIHAAAHSDAFKAVVSEGASGQSLRDELDNPGLSDRLLALPTQVSLTAALALFTDESPPPSLESEVAKISPTPVLFVYGEKGQGGTEEGPNRGFYAAAREPKQIWEVPNGQHVAGITTAPQEYERRVVGFLDDALLTTEGDTE
ncbi:MAG TPA: CocE/NonD family hydrolase [Gaiellaceae bacterium]|nr:CocE/NonD family hydrolase [Gaiellaceae bacterium]